MSITPWKRGLVIGLGTSGEAAVRLLCAIGVEVAAYDQKKGAGELPPGVKRFSGDTVPAKAFADVDVIVLSPGVPPQPIRALAKKHAPRAEIHGEMGLALQLIAVGASTAWPSVRTVLITGTNGKSTVTAMMGAILEAAERRAFVGGNLGEPLSDVLTETLTGDLMWPDDLVLECSSFQLETMPAVPTDVAMILNVTPDHLDRYASVEEYAQTKARIFEGLDDEDLALLSDGDEWADALTPDIGTTIRIGAEDGPRIEGDTLILSDDESMPRSALPLTGRHNAINALFAVTAARHLGIPLSRCRVALAAFKGLPHRMTFVRELDGVAYYNDSKATNVASALASLGGLDRRFVLIAGGKGKGDDVTPLRALLASLGAGLVAIGETADLFFDLGTGTVPTERASDLEVAVQRARAMAKPGEAVVLAPACASYDQFENYAHRGDVFTDAVMALKG